MFISQAAFFFVVEVRDIGWVSSRTVHAQTTVVQVRVQRLTQTAHTGVSLDILEGKSFRSGDTSNLRGEMKAISQDACKCIPVRCFSLCKDFYLHRFPRTMSFAIEQTLTWFDQLESCHGDCLWGESTFNPSCCPEVYHFWGDVKRTRPIGTSFA